MVNVLQSSVSTWKTENGERESMVEFKPSIFQNSIFSRPALFDCLLICLLLQQIVVCKQKVKLNELKGLRNVDATQQAKKESQNVKARENE